MRYEMKPRRPMELIDAGFQLYRNHFATFFTVTAMTQGVASVLQIVLFRWLAGTWSAPDAGAIEKNPTGSGIAYVVYGVVAVLAYVAVYAALVRATSDFYHGRNPTPLKILSAAAPRMGTAAGATFLSYIGVALGLLLLIIPGALLSLRWAFIEQAVILEGVDVGASFKRSGKLVAGHGGAVGALFLLVSILVGVINVGMGAMFAAAIRETPLLLALLQIIPIILTAPLHTIVMTLAYYDLRIRKEAYDLEAEAQEAAPLQPPTLPV